MLSLITSILLITTGVHASCGSLGPAGRTVTWHANTDSYYTGGKVNFCGCLDGLVNLESCKLEYAFPDGKSAWGTMTYCTQGKTQLESGRSICLGLSGSGYVMTA